MLKESKNQSKNNKWQKCHQDVQEQESYDKIQKKAKIKIQQKQNRTYKIHDIGKTSRDKVLNQDMTWTLDVSEVDIEL